MKRNNPENNSFDFESIRVLLDSSNDAAFLFNSTGELVALNREALKRLRKRDKKFRNKPCEYFIGKKFADFYPPDFINKCDISRKKILKTKRPERFTYRLEENFIDVIAYPVIRGDGQQYSIAVYARDITTEVFSDLRARKTEDRIMNLVEQMYEGYIITDRRGRIQYVNSAVKKIGGYENRDLIGKDSISLFPSSERDIAKVHLKKMQNLEKVRFEAKFLTKNSKLLTLLFSASPIVDENGSYDGYQTTLTDITQLRETRDKLQYRIEFEKKIIEIATGFINLQDSEIDRGIMNALGIIGTFSRENRVTLYVNSGNDNNYIKTYDWSRGHPDASYRLPDQLDISTFPHFNSIARRHRVINVPDIMALQPEELKEAEYPRRRGIKSFLIVPMVLRKKLTGLIGIASLQGKTWSSDEISMIQTALGVIAIVLERKNITGNLTEEIINRLSSREREFLTLLAAGYSWPRDKRLIGKKMDVLPGTLDKFMIRIKEKVKPAEYNMMLEHLRSSSDRSGSK